MRYLLARDTQAYFITVLSQSSSPPPYSACPGAQLAQSIMFTFAAPMLSVFNIEKVVINGVVQESNNDFSSGVFVYVPLPFFPFTHPVPRFSLLNSNSCMIYRRPKPLKSALKLRCS